MSGEVDETRGYVGQFRGWGGDWCDTGAAVYSTAREARDACISFTAVHGYSGVDVRVLRLTTSRVCEVVEVPR